MADMTLSPEHQRLIETAWETLRCPNEDAPMHAEFNCTVCAFTAEARHSLDALALKLARLEKLERGAADFLDVAERVRGGDPSLSPEAWYAERDYMRALLAAREEETA